MPAGSRRFDQVIKATVYRAVLIPPIEGMPRFDVIVLVQTTSPETISEVQTSEPYERLDADFVMAARNTRRIGDTEVGLFPGASCSTTSQLKIPRARWRCGRASPDGTPLRSAWIIPPCCNPSARRLMLSSTTCACHASRIRFTLDQFARPSFYSFVRSNLSKNGMGARPLFCEPI